MTQRELIKKVKLLSSFFKLTTRRVEAKLLSGTTYSLLEKERILRDIDSELRNLVSKTDPWFEKNLEYAYKEGSSDVMGYLKRLGVREVIYTPYDWDMIENLAGNSKMLLEEALSGIHRSSSNVLSKAVKFRLQTIIEEGRLDQKGLREIKGMIQQLLEDKSVFLLDTAGRKWDAAKYAEMFARTEMMNTYNQGVVNQMLHRGADLGQITSYPSCECDICKAWEGKIVSLTGKNPDYPALDDAYADGVFHPNCKHRVRPYIEPLLEEEGNTFSTQGGVLRSMI
jgi:hypothetical protein